MNPHGIPEKDENRRTRLARERQIVREYRKLARRIDEDRDNRIRRWAKVMERYGVDVSAVLARHGEEWP